MTPALGIMLGANDAVSYPPATFQANLQAMVTALRAEPAIAALNGGTGVDILLGIQPDPTGYETILSGYTWPEYVAAIRAVAAANANCRVVADFDFEIAGPSADTDGLYNTTTTPGHWNDLGAALAGTAAASMLNAG